MTLGRNDEEAVDDSTNFDSASGVEISNTHEDDDNNFPNLHLTTLIRKSEGEYDLSHPFAKTYRYSVKSKIIISLI